MSGDFKVGTEVRCEGIRGFVRISEGPSKKNEYLVVLGNLSIWVAARRLRPLSDTEKKAHRKKSSKSKAERQASQATLRIDLHGMKAADAERELTAIVDRGLMEGAEKIEVVFGIGKGVLRDVVERFCKNCRQVSSYVADEKNPGSGRIYL